MSDAVHVCTTSRARGPARDIKTSAYRRFIDDDREIVAVSRARIDVVYVGNGHRPRFLSISLARVAGFFEEEKDTP